MYGKKQSNNRKGLIIVFIIAFVVIFGSSMITKDAGKNKKKADKIEQPEKNNTKFLVEQIILTYFTSRWHNKILDMKNRISSRTNQKEKNLRTLVRVLQRAVNYHTYL